MTDAAVDTSSEMATKDLKEKKEVLEEAETGREGPVDGNANEENGEQETDNEEEGGGGGEEEGGGGEEEEEGGKEEEEEEGDGEEEDRDEGEEAEAARDKRAAEDDEDHGVDTKKQKTDENDQTGNKGKVIEMRKGHRDLFTLHFPSQNLNVVTCK